MVWRFHHDLNEHITPGINYLRYLSKFKLNTKNWSQSHLAGVWVRFWCLSWFAIKTVIRLTRENVYVASGWIKKFTEGRKNKGGNYFKKSLITNKFAHLFSIKISILISRQIYCHLQCFLHQIEHFFSWESIDHKKLNQTTFGRHGWVLLFNSAFKKYKYLYHQ